MNMKQLYAILIVLIVIYVGINVGANGLNILNSNDNSSPNTSSNAGGGDIAVGAGSFAKIDNFADKKINDTAVSLTSKNSNVSLTVEQIDSSLNVTDTYNSLLSGGSYTSGQAINQNGVTAYFLYHEDTNGYSSDVYFAKDNQNFKISGTNVTYENSDNFINTCKSIIDSLHVTSNNDGKISRW